MNALADQAARDRIRGDLDATLFVEAAAGTGKTTELVARIVELLASGTATLDRVVAVTFTEKAAGEMKLRLRAEIEKARAAADDASTRRQRLEAALERLELARIGTIHAFCVDVLRERPVEAGIDPLFEVAPDDEQQALIDRAFDGWFEEVLGDPGEGVRRVLRRRAIGRFASGPKGLLRQAAGRLIERRDFPGAWRRDPFEREERIDELLGRLRAVGASADDVLPRSGRTDYLREQLLIIRRFMEEQDRLEEHRGGRDYDGLEAELRNLNSPRNKWHWKGSGYTPYREGTSREETLERRDAVKATLEELLKDLDADVAPLLREELRPVVDEYARLKRRAGKLDFLDLLIETRDLIRDDAEVRAMLQRRFTHFFVDEFQDTDPLQAEILMLLAADDPEVSDADNATPTPGKLFLVGDPKQSIYRFRRADVELYERIKRRLLEGGAELVNLSVSFRSVPSLQAAVNGAFAPIMTGERDSQAGYVPLDPFRPEPDGRPTVIALPVPAPYSQWGKMVDWVVEQSLPQAVGAFVDWLIHDSGWTVTDRDQPDVPVPVRARHVCLLFRRMVTFGDDVSRPYVRALEARRIPHVLVGGRSFHEREEVLAMRNALVAIEWPDDELRVYATLRGPLFGLQDDAILAYRGRDREGGRVGRLHPLRRVELDALGGDEKAVAEALLVLRRLHYARNRRPIAQTIECLLSEVRAHAGVAIQPTGEQALANCMRIVELAHRFERRGAASFRAFVDKLELDAEQGDSQEAPAVEEGTDGVRITTTHKAKGLEFPVVILVDPTCNATHSTPSRHIDPDQAIYAEPLAGCAPKELLIHEEVELTRDRDEAARVAYVAATRARDLLVVPSFGDPEPDDRAPRWLDALRDAIQPDDARRRDSTDAPGCPAFGDDTVLERPEKARRSVDGAVRPGLHRSIAGTEVVWWDPAVLDLDRDDQTIGIRQQRILIADEQGRHEECTRAHDEWRASLDDTLERGRAPTVDVATVTARSAALSDGGEPAPTVPVEATDVVREGRPGGKRFGNLVHAILAEVPLDADREQVERYAEGQARLLGASEVEVAAAIDAVVAALSHPLLASAREAKGHGALRREAPILLRHEDGTITEGSLDLAFRTSDDDGARWTVVDFKTDRELSEQRVVYEHQITLYARAVTEATGEPATTVLLLV